MLIPLVDEGLGNSSYLVDLGDGRALAVDASRDLRALRAHGLKVAFAADTHLHADFLSGAVRLAAEDGARILASEDRAFDHVGLHDGDEVDLGGLTLRALATPGHTGEHLSYELLDGTATLGVFTGGSLIVGGAARTDLVSPEQTEPLARRQFRSLRRLAALPDQTPVWPTHGAGSFCSAAPGADRVTTIGAEKMRNRLFQLTDEESFVKELIEGLGSFPPYFLRLGELNRRGPQPVDAPVLVPLGAKDVAGKVVVDVRPIRDFAAGHIPGAISIALRDQFASWLGWLLDPATPYIIVRNPDQDPQEIVWQGLKIGYEAAGELAEPWDGPTASIPLVDPVQVQGSVLDVRQDAEFESGHLPGAVHVELGDLPATDLRKGPTVVMCGHGERAMTGASLLERAGHHEVRVMDGGAQDWAAATGGVLQR